MAGWSTPRTWVAAEKPSASTMNAHIRDQFVSINGYVLKTADESVTSSATLQDDNHLLYTISATGTYIVDCYLLATSAADAAGDLKIGFTFPAGTFHFAAAGPDTGLASGSIQTGQWNGQIAATSGTTANNYGLSTNTIYIAVHGILIASATGTLRLQWAQASSNVNASTVKIGSHMIVKQVA